MRNPRGKPFKKGHKKIENSGRKTGTPNHRTVFVKGMLEECAQRIGGLDRLIAWVEADVENERIFWSQMFMRLLPVQVSGTIRQESEFIIKIKREELARKLIERGLPPMVFGVDVPKLEDLNGNGQIIDVNGNGNGSDDA